LKIKSTILNTLNSISFKAVNSNQKANQSSFFEMNKWHDYRKLYIVF